ncbi:alanine racemase [Campylobacter sp.]|uniref:alanine racemase n=1 Tax=Campylobacter sp. TaxID=205 RepID=UPI0026FA3F76|nr:alanine racemase [Campylobacter sp.]
MSEILLNRAAYLNNLSKICEKAGGKERVILVLKDNAYGHGAKLIASEASKFGIKFAAVKNESEARELGEYFENILILSHIPTGKESEKFIYAVNDISNLSVLKSGTRVHFAVDTLMHRNGIAIDEIGQACKIANQKGLMICGAYTHFRAADEVSSDYFVQRENFKLAKEQIIKFSGTEAKNLTFHSHNSAGLERFSKLDDELVRVGIAQYGYAQFDESLDLKIVLSLYADRVSSRVLKAGQGVGYGGKFCAKEDMQIATYDLGYGDGLLRYDAERELNLASGERILGKMSMDNFSSEDGGKRVCVIKDARIWAKFFDTIEYEILVKLSPNISRRFV